MGPGKEPEGFRVRAKATVEVCRKARWKGTVINKLVEIIEEKV